MACITLPTLPPLPSILPFTIDPPALPVLDLSVDFCCRINLILAIPIPPGLLTPIVLSAPSSVVAIIASINAAITVIDAYMDAIPLDCPFD